MSSSFLSEESSLSNSTSTPTRTDTEKELIARLEERLAAKDEELKRMDEEAKKLEEQSKRRSEENKALADSNAELQKQLTQSKRSEEAAFTVASRKEDELKKQRKLASKQAPQAQQQDGRKRKSETDNNKSKGKQKLEKKKTPAAKTPRASRREEKKKAPTNHLELPSILDSIHSWYSSNGKADHNADLGDVLFTLKCGKKKNERGGLFCRHCLRGANLLPATEATSEGGRHRKRTSKVSSAGNQEEEEPPRTPLSERVLCHVCLDPSCKALVNFDKNSRQEISSMQLSKNRNYFRDHFGEETTCCERKWL